MLAALLTVWLLGGGVGSSTAGYVDQVKSYAMTALTDEAQRKAVLETAGELKRAGSKEAKAIAKAADTVVKIAGNREAKAQDFKVALSQIRGHSIELQNELVRQRFRLKSELTREQWAALHSTSGSSGSANRMSPTRTGRSVAGHGKSGKG
jgi:hypothetical protein